MKEQSMKMGWRDNRRKRIYWLTLILVVAALMTKTTSAFAQEDGAVEPASSNTADFSTQIFRPIADTYVDSANPNDSFADADILNVVRINFGNGSIQQRSYLRFDLSTIRRGAPVQAATLSLFQTTGSINPLQVNRVTAD
ncbi:MAG: DNRLRE domain-containing protein, partial [Caldilinea sp.]